MMALSVSLSRQLLKMFTLVSMQWRRSELVEPIFSRDIGPW
jgi:hypothetical protein